MCKLYHTADYVRNLTILIFKIKSKLPLEIVCQISIITDACSMAQSNINGLCRNVVYATK